MDIHIFSLMVKSYNTRLLFFPGQCQSMITSKQYYFLEYWGFCWWHFAACRKTRRNQYTIQTLISIMYAHDLVLSHVLSIKDKGRAEVGQKENGRCCFTKWRHLSNSYKKHILHFETFKILFQSPYSPSLKYTNAMTVSLTQASKGHALFPCVIGRGVMFTTCQNNKRHTVSATR